MLLVLHAPEGSHYKRRAGTRPAPIKIYGPDKSGNYKNAGTILCRRLSNNVVAPFIGLAPWHCEEPR